MEENSSKRKTRRGNAITLRKPRGLRRDETRGNKRERENMLKFHRVAVKKRKKERKKNKPPIPSKTRAERNYTHSAY